MRPGIRFRVSHKVSSQGKIREVELRVELPYLGEWESDLRTRFRIGKDNNVVGEMQTKIEYRWDTATKAGSNHRSLEDVQIDNDQTLRNLVRIMTAPQITREHQKQLARFDYVVPVGK